MAHYSTKRTADPSIHNAARRHRIRLFALGPGKQRRRVLAVVNRELERLDGGGLLLGIVLALGARPGESVLVLEGVRVAAGCGALAFVLVDVAGGGLFGDGFGDVEVKGELEGRLLCVFLRDRTCDLDRALVWVSTYSST